jgi:hypothetical protein
VKRTERTRDQCLLAQYGQRSGSPLLVHAVENHTCCSLLLHFHQHGVSIEGTALWHVSRVIWSVVTSHRPLLSLPGSVLVLPNMMIQPVDRSVARQFVTLFYHAPFQHDCWTVYDFGHGKLLCGAAPGSDSGKRLCGAALRGCSWFAFLARLTVAGCPERRAA